LKTQHESRHELRGNPFLREKVHDPYRASEKLTDAATCPQCGARYQRGRWTWSEVQADKPKSQICPACRRVNEHYPAGEVLISGAFVKAHRDEIVARAHHIEEAERGQHPLHRIMSIEEEGGTITIKTTDIHLPHRIGRALTDAWDGSMKTHYDLNGYFTRVEWNREK
jgi:NMD protein affecting ribosome stability and mRNA decay